MGEHFNVLRIIVISVTKRSRKRAQSRAINTNIRICVHTSARTVTRLSSTSITSPNTKGFTLERSLSNVQSVSKGFLILAHTASILTTDSLIVNLIEIKCKTFLIDINHFCNNILTAKKVETIYSQTQ